MNEGFASPCVLTVYGSSLRIDSTLWTITLLWSEGLSNTIMSPTWTSSMVHDLE